MRTTTRLAAIALVLLLAARGRAGTVGEVQDLAGVGARLPEAAYNSIHRTWLVVWVDYTQSGVWGRLLADDGVPEGGPFQIALGPISLFPSVTFNSRATSGWSPTRTRGTPARSTCSACAARTGRSWERRSPSPRPPRARTPTWPGARRATSTWWSSPPPATWTSTRGSSAGTASARRGHRGARRRGLLRLPGGRLGHARDEFLVTWDWDREQLRLHLGQRVDAAGELQGGPIEITTGGKQGRSTPAWDPAGQRWLVQFNDTSVPGNSFDQGGRFVNADGSLGAAVAIADTAGFEGDTILGAPVAFVAGARRYLSSFVVNTGMAVQELDAAGAKVGPQVPLAPGDFGCLGNAADHPPAGASSRSGRSSAGPGTSTRGSTRSARGWTRRRPRRCRTWRPPAGTAGSRCRGPTLRTRTSRARAWSPRRARLRPAPTTAWPSSSPERPARRSSGS
jgi:hypothetical protein